MELLKEQSGRLLLALAIVLTMLSISLSRCPVLEPVPEKDLKRPVLVELDRSALAAASSETYFVRTPSVQFLGSDRCVFVKPKKEIVFVPVDLDIPPAGVLRPPQLLPEPGPSLEGASNLPRFGDEFAPVTASVSAAPGSNTAPDPKKK